MKQAVQFMYDADISTGFLMRTNSILKHTPIMSLSTFETSHMYPF